MLFFYVHGAPARVPADATSFAARRTQWDVDVIGQWDDSAESERHTAWVRSTWDACEPFLDASGYLNHVAVEDRPEKIRASYGDNLGRLRQLKRQFDPANLFRQNANIAPA